MTFKDFFLQFKYYENLYNLIKDLSTLAHIIFILYF